MNKITTRQTLVCALAMLFGSFANAQSGQPNRIATWIQSVQESHHPKPVAPFERLIDDTRALPVANADLMIINPDELATIREELPAMIELPIPHGDDFRTLKMARVDVTAPDFYVSTPTELSSYYKSGIHYRGIIDGDNNSLASVSIFENEVIGSFSNDEGNFNISRLDNDPTAYVVFNERNLSNGSELSCMADELEQPFVNFNVESTETRGIGCKVIKIYIECDYSWYVNKGSVANVVNHITGLFNQVAILYANENIDLQLSQVYVWNTSDPYTANTSLSSIMSAFRTTRGTSFNGDVAHFLTLRPFTGGLGYVNVLTQKAYAYGISAIASTYSTVPNYSFAVSCVAHELGHNVASPHTQNCGWAGGPIDNCYPVEGGTCAPGPTPTNGGTIMSYCHMNPNIGINFNNGFGPLPGDLMRTRVINATNLTSSGAVPTGLATSSIGTNSAILAWVAVPNATQYTIQYKPATSTTWTTLPVTSSTSYTLSGLTSGVSYNWCVKTDCSSYSTAATFTTNAATVTCVAPTALAATNLSTSGATVSWASVVGATSYTVQYKASSSTSWISLAAVTGTSTSIAGLSASTTYNWQVKTNCSVYSSVSSFTTATPVTATAPVCTAPGGLTTTGTTKTSTTLKWNAVSGATSYTIKYNKVGTNKWTTVSNVTGTSRTITKLNGGSTYQWQVKSSCNANYSALATFVTPAAFLSSEGSVVLDLYPNPAKNDLHLMINGWNPSDVGVAHVYNVTGSLLKSIEVNADDNVLATNELAAGLYLIQVVKDGTTPLVARFVKQ